MEDRQGRHTDDGLEGRAQNFRMEWEEQIGRRYRKLHVAKKFLDMPVHALRLHYLLLALFFLSASQTRRRETAALHML